MPSDVAAGDEARAGRSLRRWLQFTTRLAALSALSLGAGVGAQNVDGVFYVMEAPSEAVSYTSLGRGQASSFAFRVNAPGDPGFAHVAGLMEVPADVLSQYSFVPADPARCQAPVIWLRSDNAPVVRFRVGPLARGESVECRYQVTRRVDSSSDLGFYLCDRGNLWCRRRIRLGSLPDLSLSAVPVVRPDARGLQYARITVHNPSSEPIEATNVHTGCAEFGGGMGGGIAFLFEYDFPDACPRGQSEPCLNFTGQNFDSYGFSVGPVAPASSRSCLVGMRPGGSGIHPRIGLSFYGDDMLLVGGGKGFDANAQNNLAQVGVGVLGPLSAPAVPLGAWGHWLTGLLLLGTGVLTLGRWGE